MAEIRLNKLIKQFNIGLDTLVDFLNSKGAGIEHANPNTKISDEYLPDLHARFAKDLSLKKSAERVDVKLSEILDKSARRTSSTPKVTEELKESGIRLGKIIKDLNIGLETLVDYLEELGLEIEFDPNAWVPRSFMPSILKQFGNETKEIEVPKPEFATDEYWDATPDPSIKDFRSIWQKPTVRLSKLMRRYQVGIEDLLQHIKEFGVVIKDPEPASKVSIDLISKLDSVLSVKIDNLEDVEVNAPTSTEPVSSIKEKLENEELQNEMRKPLPASVAPEDFDWDAFEADIVLGETREEVAELYEKTKRPVVENTIVEGVVTAINRREVTVNIGARSEGVISTPEFRYNPDLKVGDKVEVLVENAEDRMGKLVISHKKARQLRSWDMVNAAYENNEVVKCYVKTRTKGGMIVDVFGIEAFLPGSQIDVKPVKDFDSYVDTTLDVKIIKVNQEFRNIVVSHRALFEAPKKDTKVSEANLDARTVQARQKLPVPEIDPSTFFSAKAQKLLNTKKGD